MTTHARRRLAWLCALALAAGAAAIAIASQLEAPDGTCAGACVAWVIPGTVALMAGAVVWLLILVGAMDD